MTVRRNQRKRWLVDIVWTRPDGSLQRIRKTSPIQTRRGTEQYERQIRSELVAGTYGKRQAPTIEEAMEDYLNLVVDGHVKPATLALYRSSWRANIQPAFKGYRVDEIDARRIGRLVAKMRKSHAPASINTLLAPLRGCLKACVTWGDLDAAPKVPMLRTELKEIVVLTPEQISALLEKLATPWRSMVLVALRTGLRIGELLALRWRDVDLKPKQPRIHVKQRIYLGLIDTPKGGRGRTIPLTSEAALTLKRHPRTLRSPLVWTSPYGGYYKYARARSELLTAARAAGINHIGWHTLRHTCGAVLTSRLGNLRVVQEILGHSKISTTMRYAHLLPGTISGIDCLDGYGTITAPVNSKVEEDV